MSGISSYRDDWDDGSAAELLRAQVYTMLARLLSQPPTPELLHVIGTLEGDDTALGRPLRILSETARRVPQSMIEAEYFTLFRCENAELLPHRSEFPFLIGGHHETPDCLAKIREDFSQLNICGVGGGAGPEDHISCLLEAMAGLITGAFGQPVDLMTQQTFYADHLVDWAPVFFDKLERSTAAAFYMPVGSLGKAFLQVETNAFALAA